MNKVNLFIMVVMTALTVALLALVNLPRGELPPWPDKIQGFSFAPFHVDQDPQKQIFPTEEQIDADLALLAGKTNAVRTYTLEGTLSKIPELARKHKLNVALGAWLSKDEEKNTAEVDKLLEVISQQRNIVRVMVGNESLLREELTVDQLAVHLDRVRKKVIQPVSTAEPWHIWLKNPKLVEHVDYIAVQMLPYWEKVRLEDAVGYIVDRINEVKKAYPNKPIVISEVGWPSNGRSRGGAEASDSNEATFLRSFLARAYKENYIYYVMEAFDQPWKTSFEGAVGAYWGVYDVWRAPKFAFSDPIVWLPEWRVLALISVVIAAILFGLVLVDSKTLGHRGKGFLALVVYGVAMASVLVIHDYSRQYLTLSSIIVGVLLFIGMLGVIIVLLAEAHEWAEAHWVSGRRRDLRPIVVDEDQLPLVSIHVPAYNEPPDMMIETLDALAKLDYPRFEVVVIDNNTKDPAVWEPVRDHCAKLGPHFRFFHEDPLAGFKAGALNFALRQTNPEAEVVAVIDSDYMVDPQWLRELVPQFVVHPKLAIVQAPQDYRDEHENAFKAMCYAEYRGFFYIGMITRNERNAIIQHGTMTMVRRKVLEEIGWSEWCITEDAELGLNIFERQHEALYIPKSYGRGVMPDNFTDFKKQRFRWAYGSVQILRRHMESLFRPSNETLTLGQRYHFVAGWLPWLADSINLLFNFAAIAWSLGMIVAPKHIDPPLIIFAILPVTLFTFKIAKLVYLYRKRVEASVTQTIASAFAGLALSHTIAKAMLTGFVTTGLPFFRTPKMATSQAWLRAILECREELLFMIALWLAAYGVLAVRPEQGLDLTVWVILLLIQSLPYLSTLIVSLISAFPQLPAWLISPSPTVPAKPSLIRVGLGSLSSAAVYIAALFGYGALMQNYGGFNNAHAGGQWLEIALLLYLYGLFYNLLKPSVWRGLLAGAPALLLYLAHDIYYLAQGSLPRLVDIGGLPEWLQVIPTLYAVLAGLAILLTLVLAILSIDRRRPWVKALWLVPLTVVTLLVLTVPESFGSRLEYLTGKQLKDAGNQGVEANGRLTMLLYREAQRVSASRQLDPYRDRKAFDQQLVQLTEQLKPVANGRNVHLIVLESFLDPRLFGRVQFSTTPSHSAFDRLFGNRLGLSISPVFGSGGAQAEFEVLCGVPAFAALSSLEFDSFSGAAANCLPAQLSKLGYRSVASNADRPSHYSSNAYKGSGFAESYFPRESGGSANSYLSAAPAGEELYPFDKELFTQNLAFVKEHLEQHKGEPLFNYLVTNYGRSPHLLDNTQRTQRVKLKSSFPDDHLDRATNQFYYRTEAVADYVQQLMKLDQQALIILVSGNVPPLRYGLNSYSALGYLENIDKNYLYNRIAIVDNGDVKRYPPMHHHDLPALVLEAVSQGEYCKQHRCDFKLDKPQPNPQAFEEYMRLLSHASE